MSEDIHSEYEIVNHVLKWPSNLCVIVKTRRLETQSLVQIMVTFIGTLQISAKQGPDSRFIRGEY